MLRVGDWRMARNTLARWFNTAAFAKNVAGAYGNARVAIIPGRTNWNLDGALSRSFKVTF